MPFQSQGKGTIAPIIKVETKRHIDAFEYYYKAGTKRSMRDTAKFAKVSLPTIQNWARSFDWKGRIARRDQSIATKIEEEIVQISSERLANWEDKSLELIEKYLEKAQAWFDNPRTYLRPEDFERILNILMKLKRFETEMNQTTNVYVPPTIIINQPYQPTGTNGPQQSDGSSEVIEATALPQLSAPTEDAEHGLLAAPDTSMERDRGPESSGLQEDSSHDWRNRFGKNMVRSEMDVEAVHDEAGDQNLSDRNRLPETRGTSNDVRDHEVSDGRTGQSGPETSGTGDEGRSGL